MIAHDRIITLPSGTELSVEAAIGDIKRARAFIDCEAEGIEDPELFTEASGHIADLDHIPELLVWLAARVWSMSNA